MRPELQSLCSFTPLVCERMVWRLWDTSSRGHKKEWVTGNFRLTVQAKACLSPAWGPVVQKKVLLATPASMTEKDLETPDFF